MKINIVSYRFSTTTKAISYYGARNAQHTYVMENQALEVVTEEKDLGVTVCNNLKPARQCRLAYTKAGKALGLISRTISFKSASFLLKLYKLLVRPHLEYCVSAWSPYYEKDKFLLERIQHLSLIHI